MHVLSVSNPALAAKSNKPLLLEFRKNSGKRGRTAIKGHHFADDDD